MTRRGFTLLELMLSTAMIAMLALTLYAAMYTGFRARTSMMRQSTDLRTATIALDLIEQDLQCVLPPTGTLAGPFVGYAMGSPGKETDSVELYTVGRDLTVTDSPMSEGFRRVQLAMRTDTPTPTLVRRVTRNLLAPTPAEPVEEVLAENVVGFSITYYDGTSWYEEWDSTQQADVLPTAVQVTIRFAATRDESTGEPYSLSRLIMLPCGGAASETTTTATGGAS